ncbi:MAG TPA: TolC family protein [Terriglobales bacterium]
MKRYFPTAIGTLLWCALAASAQTPTANQASHGMTLQEAEQLALKNNPQITVSKLLALAQGQVSREVRSVEFPQATGNLTAVEPREGGTRITAGVLNAPNVFERAAGGVTFGQLITDFGRTGNLVASANLNEKAAAQNQIATQADITLAVDQAFYKALAAQALLNVAQQTVAARQTTADQVEALTKAKLKSDLDLSFANVNLAQAKLLLLDAENNKATAFANLNTLLGFERMQSYLLVDESGAPLPAAPTNQDQLVDLALHSRPDLAALEYRSESAEKFRRAEHDLLRPSVSALAAVGGTPVRVPQLTSWYGAVGVNVSIPLFNGFQFNARAKEADYRAAAAQQQVRDLRDRIARDVDVTYLQAQSSFQRVNVTAQLLAQANLALDLAKTRYELGLGSIVELSQALLQQTEAAIGNTNARYEYLSPLSSLRFQTGQ